MFDHTPLLLAAWLALASAAISPGPNLVAVASRALGSGRQSALTVAAGLAAGAFFWSFLTAVGLGTLFSAYPALLLILGVVGGTYLVWLGFKGWRAAFIGTGGQIKAVQGHGMWTDFAHGLTVTATNPKVVLLWASLSTFVGPAMTNTAVLMMFTLGSAAIIFTIYGTYGLLFSLGGVRGVYHQFERISEALFGSMFGLLGMFPQLYRAFHAISLWHVLDELRARFFRDGCDHSLLRGAWGLRRCALAFSGAEISLSLDPTDLHGPHDRSGDPALCNL